MNQQPVYSVTDFVAVCNQVLDLSFGAAQIVGELANFKVSKNRWVYFDLKDEHSSVRFFGTIYNLPGPLEDGMVLTVTGTPQLHPRFGFSITVQTIQLSGEGTIKKASKLLEQKLAKEGLFEAARKRMLPYPPQTLGLITSGESAAYADFIKVLGQRWSGVHIIHADVQVQGENAPTQITTAIQHFNSHADQPDVLVVIRGGGSADDLQAFSSESVTRAVAGSRIPTLVAIGHETDISLAELAADLRASTPSNAAELLVPDKAQARESLVILQDRAEDLIRELVKDYYHQLGAISEAGIDLLESKVANARQMVMYSKSAMMALSPERVLKRGYAIVRKQGKVVSSSKQVVGTDLRVTLSDGSMDVKVV
jgi:exodeoxyribonuclease VII large subunit